MRIPTTYFGPAELKKSEYYDQLLADSVCNTLSFSWANCSTCIKPAKLQLTYTYLITAYYGFSFETSRFICLFQLTITLQHFKYELGSYRLEFM